MVGSYSPHSDGGGTLHLPSPTHIHHVDPTSAFKQLRRSLSRSPSKAPAFRLVTSKSISPTPNSPLSPSRERQQSAPVVSGVLPPPRISSRSPLATPLPSSARKPRPTSRRLSPMRSSSRSTSIQSSPRKRALNESRHSGNVTPQSSQGSSDDQENINQGRISPLALPNQGGLLKASAPVLQGSPFTAPRGTTRFEKGYSSWSAKSSPLKRSDGIMNFDQGGGGSPSAKRRSLHGGIFGPDFDIFDHEATSEGQDTPMAGTDSSLESFSTTDRLSPMPKRTSSLRKTTLQQRHDKPLFARPKLNTDVGLDAVTPGPTASKTKFRTSMDGALPSMPRDSPFSNQGGLPNASAHPFSQNSNRTAGIPALSHPQRHPLSRTISQSTSNSSMAEDSPTHIPIRQPEHRRPFVDFSKSLPVGANHPDSQDDGSSTQVSSGTSFATPENYKLVKPLPAAFMSTGLISKRHKNIEDSQPALNASTSTMPDTPCKRHSLAETSSPAPQQEPMVKSHQVRHSFGTPSTPFNPHVGRPSPEAFGKGVSIFGTGYGPTQSQRRPSFLGHDGEDKFQSPPGQVDSQSSAEFEIPPTPTKQVLAADPNKATTFGTSIQQVFSTAVSRGSVKKTPHSSTQAQNSKSSLHIIPSRTTFGNSDSSSGNILASALKSKGFSSVPRSFTNARILRNSRSPAPLNELCLFKSQHSSERSKTKSSPSNLASPLASHVHRLSPRTPRENMMPPDPSGLSISAHGDDQNRPLNETASKSPFAPPATPTAPRGSLASFGKSNASVTPSHTPASIEVDPVLTSKFDKVELIGTGEFSQVYRVSKAQELKSVRSYFSIPTSRASPKTPLPDRIWAVKKTRHAYIGPKDRQRKLQEVNTLKSLGRSDHTLELFDSWEDRNHLYIQTEFCEEGSLDTFLDQVGRRARLDDFRIWKVLLEMSLGVKHIHDSGFIHLDLKPANVLITFEGVLKIADFGMATRWPAPPGIDGEGDREYIGPEILRGQFDKPADVFALGLIVLEIAGNVMLPDNGASWQRLRTGDMSDVPSLTWSSETSNILRDSSGRPLSQTESVEEFYDSGSGDDDDFGSPKPFHGSRRRRVKKASSQCQRHGELAIPPAFMSDQKNPDALDNIVRWMISPQAHDRPVVDQVLATAGVQWAESRRRAGATIFEGNWGPADEVLADDSEMIDV